MNRTRESQRRITAEVARFMERERGHVRFILEQLANYWLEAQSYRIDGGQIVEGILLDRNACELLLRWWGKVRKPVPRGRPPSQPSLFGNPYKREFDEEKQKILISRKKVRGATKEAICILAERHRVTFDTMRKRISGK
jgi:hypothetical protein